MMGSLDGTLSYYPVQGARDANNSFQELHERWERLAQFEHTLQCSGWFRRVEHKSRGGQVDGCRAGGWNTG